MTDANTAIQLQGLLDKAIMQPIDANLFAFFEALEMSVAKCPPYEKGLAEQHAKKCLQPVTRWTELDMYLGRECARGRFPKINRLYLEVLEEKA